MRKTAPVLVFASLTALTGSAHAAAIVSFPLDPSLIGSPMPAGAYVAQSSGLNGTPLNGQLLSLDLIYADGILARVLNSTQISMGLSLSTNASFSCTVPGMPVPNCGNWPGFPGGLTGYLLAPDGSALHSPQAVGGGMTSAGLVVVSLGSVSAPPGPAGLDLSGVHMEFFLPNSGFEVTDASLGLGVDGRLATVQFGTAAQLPDGDAWSLIPIASFVSIGTLFTVRFLRDRRHRSLAS